MKSVMTHQFSQVPRAEIERSSFNRSHGYKTTFNAGLLIPFYVDEALPGDTFNLKATLFARIATLIKPPMDNMMLDTFFFSVPYRLVWSNWEKFNGEQLTPGASIDFEIPQMVSPAGGYQTGSIMDYMGLPVGVSGVTHSALPLRAYNLIYNNWFRDENLCAQAKEEKGNGPDDYSDYAVYKRGKRHDYFTSCLPWAQKGSDVSLPLATKAPIKGIGLVSPYSFGATNQAVHESGQTTGTISYANAAPLNASSSTWYGNQDNDNPGYPNIYADLATATMNTINNIRQAFQIQRLLERDARGGTRYPEIIKSHFGVYDPQFDVLQRPQYLGGGTSNVSVSAVAQNSGTPADTGYTDTPQANLSAYGTITASGHGFTKSFTEHCIIMGILCVRADLTYSQGLDRMWSRKTRYDHYWPALSHLGEQAVLNKEIFTQGTSVDNNAFGYQERYAEYRYKPSKITGKFRSTETGNTPLDYWHLSQEFANLPVLGQTFIEENIPMERIIAVPTEPHFLLDSFIELVCARPMPVYSVPGMIDHF